MNREQLLDRAKQLVAGQREQDYGTPEDNFQRIADLWNAYLGGGIRLLPADVAAMMGLLKIARTSYEEGRMMLEEYLRYIDALYETEADYYKTRAAYWQTLAQIAFVYGNRFEKIVR